MKHMRNFVDSMITVGITALAVTLCAAPALAQTVFINEVHYDNAGSDMEEAVEIAGPADMDLSNWRIVLYNGKRGKPYRTMELKGVIADQQNGFGTLSFPLKQLQNGSPDGMALVNPDGEIVQFLSYEGAFTATEGVAEGTMSQDIGVAESNKTPKGYSLQLQGSGASSSAFTWQGPIAESLGKVNPGQTFVAAPLKNKSDIEGVANAEP